MVGEEKAIEELARLGQQALTTGERAGGWFVTVFGEGFRHLGDTFADEMALLRLRNRLRVIEKAGKAIADAGLAGQTQSLNERIALPLLDAISDESNDAVQQTWAIFIRNAVDPKRPSPDRILVDVIRKFDPSDLPVLKRLFKEGTSVFHVDDFAMPEEMLEQSMDRFTDLGLFDHDNPDAMILVTEEHDDKRLRVVVGRNSYYARRLLQRLKASVKEEGAT